MSATDSLELVLERNIHAPGIARSAVSERLVELGVDGSYGQTIVHREPSWVSVAATSQPT